jgi:hypothetical protein
MNKTEITKEIMKAVTKNNNEKYKWQHFIAKDVAMFYPNIEKPKDWGDNTTPKYGITIVIPQEDKTAIESITNSYNTIAEKFKLNLLDYTYTNKFKNGNEFLFTTYQTEEENAHFMSTIDSNSIGESSRKIEETKRIRV